MSIRQIRYFGILLALLTFANSVLIFYAIWCEFTQVAPFLLPLFPLVNHSFLLLVNRHVVRRRLNEIQMGRDVVRAMVLPMAGFSFSALLAVTLVNAASQLTLYATAYFLLLSFLGYLFVVNLQSYKTHQWVNQLSHATMELASGCLIMSIVYTMWTAELRAPFYVERVVMTAVAAIVWGGDHLAHQTLYWMSYTGSIPRVRPTSDRRK